MLIIVLLHLLQKFLRNKYFNKLQFIPNPVDQSIDNLKNYKNNTLNLIFFCNKSWSK